MSVQSVFSRAQRGSCVGLLWALNRFNPAVTSVCVDACRKELAEAQRANKPCGKCHFYLLISKTFVEAGKSGSKKRRDGLQQEALMFANAEEEFFYEVRMDCFISLLAVSRISLKIRLIHRIYAKVLLFSVVSGYWLTHCPVHRAHTKAFHYTV